MKRFPWCKSLATLLAVLTIYQTAAMPVAEASFWEARKAALSTPVAEPLNPANLNLQASLSSYGVSAHLPLSGFSVPSDLGSIVSTYYPTGQNGNNPLIIHIQDAHEITGAQQNAAEILKTIHESIPGSALVVAVEGAWGPVNSDRMAAFPNKSTKVLVAESFLAQKKLFGEEARAIMDAPGSWKIVGIEDKDLYLANGAAKARVEEAQVHVLPYFTAIQNILRQLSARYDSADLRYFKRKTREYSTGRLPLVDYLRCIQETAPASLDRSFLNLRKVTRLSGIEKTVRAEWVQDERKKLVEQAARRLGQKDLQVLLDQSVAFRLGRISPLAYHEFLIHIAYGLNVPVPNLANYVRYLKFYESIDMDGIPGELGDLQGKAGEILASNAESKTLLRLEKWFTLQEKAWNLDLTPGEFGDNEKAEMGWTGFGRSLSSLLKAAHIEAALPAGPQELASRAGSISDFYRLAEARSKALVANTLKLEDANRSCHSPIILIAGGYHTSDITRLLKQKSQPYMVIRPSLESKRLSVLLLARAATDSNECGTYRLVSHLFSGAVGPNALSAAQKILDFHAGDTVSGVYEAAAASGQTIYAVRLENGTYLTAPAVIVDKVVKGDPLTEEELESAVSTLSEEAGDRLVQSRGSDGASSSPSYFANLASRFVRRSTVAPANRLVSLLNRTATTGQQAVSRARQNLAFDRTGFPALPIVGSISAILAGVVMFGFASVSAAIPMIVGGALLALTGFTFLIRSIRQTGSLPVPANHVSNFAALGAMIFGTALTAGGFGLLEDDLSGKKQTVVPGISAPTESAAPNKVLQAYQQDFYDAMKIHQEGFSFKTRDRRLVKIVESMLANHFTSDSLTPSKVTTLIYDEQLRHAMEEKIKTQGKSADGSDQPLDSMIRFDFPDNTNAFAQQIHAGGAARTTAFVKLAEAYAKQGRTARAYEAYKIAYFAAWKIDSADLRDPELQMIAESMSGTGIEGLSLTSGIAANGIGDMRLREKTLEKIKGPHKLVLQKRGGFTAPEVVISLALIFGSAGAVLLGASLTAVAFIAAGALILAGGVYWAYHAGWIGRPQNANKTTEDQLREMTQRAGLTPAGLADGTATGAKVSAFNVHAGGLEAVLNGRSMQEAASVPVQLPPESSVTREQKIEFLQRVARGELSWIRFSAGQATRLKLPAVFDNLGIIGLTEEIIKALPEDQSIMPKEEDFHDRVARAMRGEGSLSIGQSGMLQLSYELKKLVEEVGAEAGVSLDQALAGVHFTDIVNETNRDAIAAQNAAIHFAGFNPSNVYLLVQSKEGGLVADATGQKLVFTEDEKFPAGHGVPVIQISRDPHAAYHFDAEGQLVPLGASLSQTLKQAGVKSDLFAQINDINLMSSMVSISRWDTAGSIMHKTGAGMIMEMVDNRKEPNPAGGEWYQKGGGAFDDAGGKAHLRDTLAMEEAARPPVLSRMFYFFNHDALDSLDWSDLIYYLNIRKMRDGRSMVAREAYSGDLSSKIRGGARTMKEDGLQIRTYKLRPNNKIPLKAFADQRAQPGFPLTTHDLQDVTAKGISELKAARQGQPSPLVYHDSGLPIPTGLERGKAIAADFGGSTAKLRMIELKDGGIADLNPIEKNDFVRGADAGQVDDIYVAMNAFATHLAHYLHQEGLDRKDIPIGMTFAHPLEKTENGFVIAGLSKGWGDPRGKVIGKDPVALINSLLAARGVKARIVVIANDTMDGAWGKMWEDGESNITVSASEILGTGHNGGIFDPVLRRMVNTEFGGSRSADPLQTPTQLMADAQRPNHTVHTFEKQVSAPYLAEEVRRQWNPPTLSGPDQLPGVFLSDIAVREPSDIVAYLKTKYGVTTTPAEALRLKNIVKDVVARSALLAGAGIVAKLSLFDPGITRSHVVTIQGSLFQYPGYEGLLMKGIEQVVGPQKAGLIQLQYRENQIGLGIAAVTLAVHSQVQILGRILILANTLRDVPSLYTHAPVAISRLLIQIVPLATQLSSRTAASLKGIPQGEPVTSDQLQLINSDVAAIRSLVQSTGLNNGIREMSDQLGTLSKSLDVILGKGISQPPAASRRAGSASPLLLLALTGISVLAMGAASILPGLVSLLSSAQTALQPVIATASLGAGSLFNLFFSAGLDGLFHKVIVAVGVALPITFIVMRSLGGLLGAGSSDVDVQSRGVSLKHDLVFSKNDYVRRTGSIAVEAVPQEAPGRVDHIMIPLSAFTFSTKLNEDGGVVEHSPEFVTNTLNTILTIVRKGQSQSDLLLPEQSQVRVQVHILNDIPGAIPEQILHLDRLSPVDHKIFNMMEPSSISGMLREGRTGVTVDVGRVVESILRDMHGGEQSSFSLLRAQGNGEFLLQDDLAKLVHVIDYQVYKKDGRSYANLALGFLFAKGPLSRGQIGAIIDSLKNVGVDVSKIGGKSDSSDGFMTLLTVPMSTEMGEGLHDVYKNVETTLIQA